jgi:hypothetical protein
MDYSDEEIVERPQISDEEIILRALFPPFWDAAKKRASTSAFMNARTSVNRLALHTKNQIVEVWKRDLESKDRRIDAALRARVKIIRDQGLPTNKDSTASIFVVNAEHVGNESHAEILGLAGNPRKLKKLSRGTANRILEGSETIPLRGPIAFYFVRASQPVISLFRTGSTWIMRKLRGQKPS